MAEFRHIVILTGAGLSAESGVATFRDRDGIWAKYDFNEVATPEGFRANPQLVHDFYNQRRRGLLGVAQTPRTLRSPDSTASIRAP
jgi:NAD-dependent deacetylase